MIPQIYTVTPATGSTMGEERVTITGYGFKVPTQTAFAEADTDWPEREATVLVEFNGEVCPYVLVFSDREVVVVTPKYHGAAASLPDSVNVVLKNLDSSGVPIPGEVATRVNSYQYHRESLVDQGPLQWLTRQLAENLAVHLCPNIAMSSSPDYSDDPTAGMVAVSELPVVVLEGPTTRKAKDGNEQVADAVATALDNGDMAVDAQPLLRDVVFGIIIYARSKTEAMNMQSVAEHYFERCPTLDVLDAPGGSRISIEWVCGGEGRAVDRPADKVFTVEGLELTLAHVLLGRNLCTRDGVQTPVSEDTEDAAVLVATELPD